MLSNEDLKILKQKISEAIKQTGLDIKSLREATKPVSPDNAIGRLTRMEAIQSKHMNEAALCSVEKKRSLLKDALNNIDDPDFGICKRCEEPIPIGRIMLMPETTLCVNCAED
ncbi:MAG: TraR/DksA C4-type zinc finger protein [Desulfobacterales bacterium]|nr:TraR/DksA C4-type zinc finger protein [Desulfobacterales bacterium]